MRNADQKRFLSALTKVKFRVFENPRYDLFDFLLEALIEPDRVAFIPIHIRLWV